MLPSSFSTDDVNQLLQHVIKLLESDAIILCDVILTSRPFIESCLPFFDDLIKAKSEKVSASVPSSVVIIDLRK